MKHIAVLIDAENVSSKHWVKIKDQVAKWGRMSICRVFGNLVEERLKNWCSVAEEEALQPMLQFAGSNACDIALTISAMDLLHSGKLQAVCIVSSDGDFTPLVHRLKAGGLIVYGIGGSKTAPTLQRACTEFKSLTDLTAPTVLPNAA